MVNKQTGATVHCHDSRSKAAAQIAAIMASENKMNDNDTLIYFGDPIKALDDNGKVGGYLVRFSDGSKKDLTGEWFTDKTYLGPKDGDGAEAIFDHGFPIMPKLTKGLDKDTLKAIESFADRTFTPLKTKRDPVGIWAETVLDISDDYEKMVFGLVKKEKLGWSSGAAGHRVVKNAEGQILRWPIAEGSLTPRPAEPLNKAISLKSLLADEPDENDQDLVPKPSGSLSKALNQRIEDMVDEGRTKENLIKQISKAAFLDEALVVKTLANEYRPTPVELKAIARTLGIDFEQLKNLNAGGRSIKDIFEEAMAEHEPSRWMLDCTWSDLMTKLVTAAAASKLTGVEFDLEGKIDEATDGYCERLKDLAKTQAQEYLDSGEDETFYVRALADPSTNDFVSAKHVDIEDHIALVVSALRSIATRFRANHEGRIKAGRQLSEKNRNRLSKLMEQGMAWMTELQTLLDETKPMASDMEKRLAQTQHARQQWRLYKLGANTDANISAGAG